MTDKDNESHQPRTREVVFPELAEARAAADQTAKGQDGGVVIECANKYLAVLAHRNLMLIAYYNQQTGP